MDPGIIVARCRIRQLYPQAVRKAGLVSHQALPIPLEAATRESTVIEFLQPIV